MRRPRLIAAAGVAILLLIYLAAWPVPVEPVAWEAPPNPGYAGTFATNTRLAAAEQIQLGEGRVGPEDLAADRAGRVYASTRDGQIVRIAADGSVEPFADTGGAPLGLAFDGEGTLLVADAYLGLLGVSPTGEVALLANEAGGVPIAYADDVAVAPDGRVYLTDASTKFGAAEYGDPFAASLLDMLEHGAHGRLLRHDPVRRRTDVIVSGIDFANGVAVDPAGRFVLVVETGAYRVLRHHLLGPKAGETEVFAGPFPGFPDNIEAGRDGRFWVGLVSPRSAALDALSAWPGLRRVVQRLPAVLRPSAKAYGHLIALDAEGNVVADLQAPDGTYAYVTGALEVGEWLWISSLKARALARLPLTDVPLPQK